MLRRLASLEVAACVALLAAITGLVFVAAISRFLIHPIPWSADMAQLLFAWLCVFGANRAIRVKAHIGMEALCKYFPYRLRLVVETAMTLVILAFLAVLVVKGWELTWQNRERLFGDSSIPYALVTAAIPAGCLLFAASLLAALAGAWRGDGLVYTRGDGGDASSQAEI